MIALLAFFVSVVAETAAGEPSPELAAAVDAWLEDDDETAIPRLAKLARSGDEDAMLLLGQIALRPYSFSGYLRSLGVDERNALLKAPGGRPGESWLEHVEGEKELAEALLNLDVRRAWLEVIEFLLSRGETGQAVRLMTRYAERDEIDAFLELGRQPDFPEEVRFELWRTAFGRLVFGPGYSPLRAAHLAEGLDAIKSKQLPGYMFAKYISRDVDPDSKILTRDDVEVGALLRQGKFAREVDFKYEPKPLTAEDKERLLAEAQSAVVSWPAARALTDMCRDRCPEDVNGCVWALYLGVGYYEGLLEIQSPLEKLVPASRYIDSPRHKADIARKVSRSLLPIFRNKEFRSRNACTMEMVESLAR